MANNNTIKKIDPYSLSQDFSKFYDELSKCNNMHIIDVIQKAQDDLVIIRITIKVTLPQRRSNMKVDIRENESIDLICSISEILYKAPLVFSIRSDFPVEKLPHTIAYSNSLSYICLHRGSIDDWYIEHSVEDFINRIRSWFSDAASGRLIKSGDDFEPMIIDKDTGKIVYSYNKITSFIESYWENNNGKSGYAFILYTFNFGKELDYLTTGTNSFSVQVTEIYEKNRLEELVREFQLSSSIRKLNKFIGILTWPPKKTKYDQYFKVSKIKLNELSDLNRTLENNFHNALNVLKNKEITSPLAVLISAINRPTKLIGYSKNIELLNFIFEMKVVKKYKTVHFDPLGTVLALEHFEPLTSSLATSISKQVYSYTNKKILIVGAGALGSKEIFHIARNGYINLTVIDNDILLPHNLVRHALFADSLTKNKATEIVDKLKEIYYFDPLKSFEAFNDSFIHFSKSNDLSNYDVLLDFSASKSVISYIADCTSVLPNTIIRGELAYEGKLGLLLIKGSNQSPRIDELQMVLFKQSLTNKDISDWLQSYQNVKNTIGEAQFEDISIGMGCNTNTMKLADDIISYHASIFANYIKNVLQNSTNGNLVVSYFDEKDYSRNYVKIISVKEFLTIKSNNRQWTVKLYSEAYERIKVDLKKNNPNETGGILIGHIDLNKKIIYILDIFIPTDSKSSPYLFRKGCEGIHDYLGDIFHKTGGLITYVGDWHTHPNHNTGMSDLDQKSLIELKSNLTGSLYPAHIMIFNNTKFSSYIL